MEIINIYFVIQDSATIGGAQRVTQMLSNYLAKDQLYHVTVISLGEPTQSILPFERNVQLVYLNTKKGWLNKRNKLSKFMKQMDSGIVICIGSLMNYLVSTMNLEHKIIATQHSYIRKRNFLFDYTRKILLNRLDCYVYLSEDMKEDMQSWISVKNHVVISNPIIGSRTTLLNTIKQHVILSVGRLVISKNFDQLIKAWGKVKNKGDWVVNIYGDGPMRIELENLINHLGLQDSVRLMGFCTDTEKIYNNASISVMTSQIEGMPMFLLESMA